MLNNARELLGSCISQEPLRLCEIKENYFSSKTDHNLIQLSGTVMEFCPIETWNINISVSTFARNAMVSGIVRTSILHLPFFPSRLLLWELNFILIWRKELTVHQCCRTSMFLGCVLSSSWIKLFLFRFIEGKAAGRRTVCSHSALLHICYGIYITFSFSQRDRKGLMLEYLILRHYLPWLQE